MTCNAVLRAATLLLSVDYEQVINQGETARLLSRLADQSLVLAGTGLLLGLGVGAILSAAGVYLFKQRQFNEMLQS
jgi:hypothetical protein